LIIRITSFQRIILFVAGNSKLYSQHEVDARELMRIVVRNERTWRILEEVEGRRWSRGGTRPREERISERKR
jgi:hypothetical protein